MENNQLTLAQRVETNLNEVEKKAYEKYLSDGKPSLSPKTAAEFYELFVNGSTTEEIASLNPAFGLGIIVKARIDYSWDLKKEEYQVRLFETIKEKLQKTQLEAVDFSANSMAVFHKYWNSKFKRYLQTGNESELGEFKVNSFKLYKDIAENLLKLSGQDKKQVVNSGEIVHRIEAPVSKTISSKEAAEILKTIDGDFAKKG